MTCQYCGYNNPRLDLIAQRILERPGHDHGQWLHHLSSTNALPDPVEELELHQNLASFTNDVSLLQKEIDHLQEHLSGLKKRYRRLKLSADRCKTALAPHRRVPADVLSEIFRIAYDRRWSIFDDATEVDVRWRLGQVCHRWREIVVNDSFLWSVIVVSEHSVKLKPLHHLSLLKEHLIRSGSYPLTISLTHSTDYTSSFRWRDVLLLLATNAHRWRQVTLSCPLDVLRSLDSIQRPNLPVLSTLDITIYHRFPSAGSTPFVFFSEAPKLRILAYKNYSPAPMLLPWSQLTWFSGSADSPRDCAVTLRRSPMLRHYFLGIEDKWGYSNTPAASGLQPSPVSHPNIEKMQVETEKMLACFDQLPALRHLTVAYTDKADPLRSMLDLIVRQRSPVLLKTLQIRDILESTPPYNFARFDPLFERCSRMEDLRVQVRSDSSFQTTVFPLLRSLRHLPRLSHFLIAFECWDENNFQQPFFDLLQEVGVSRKLRSFQLLYQWIRKDPELVPSFITKAHQRVKEVLGDGVQVEVRNGIWPDDNDTVMDGE